MRNLLSDVWAFVCAVFSHWSTLATGGGIMALAWLLNSAVGYPIPSWLNPTLAILFLAIAAFMAWRDERRAGSSHKGPRAVLDGLAPLLDAGIALQGKLPHLGQNRDGFDFNTLDFEAKKWAEEVRMYLEERVGLMAVSNFDHAPYGIMTTQPHPSDAVIVFIGSRLQGLKQEIAKLEGGILNRP